MIRSTCVKELGISGADSCCFHLHNKASRRYILIIIQLLRDSWRIQEQRKTKDMSTGIDSWTGINIAYLWRRDISVVYFRTHFQYLNSSEIILIIYTKAFWLWHDAVWQMVTYISKFKYLNFSNRNQKM
jgi:hypothetical protein